MVGLLRICDLPDVAFQSGLTLASAFICSDEVVASIEKVQPTGTELPVRITLFQGMPKKDKLELIIQKAVELGACEIVPVMTKRTVVKLSEEKKRGYSLR